MKIAEQIDEIWTRGEVRRMMRPLYIEGGIILLLGCILALVLWRSSQTRLSQSVPRERLVELTPPAIRQLGVGQERKYSRDALWVCNDGRAYLDTSALVVAGGINDNSDLITVRRDEIGLIVSWMPGKYGTHEQPPPDGYTEASIEVSGLYEQGR